MTGRTAARCRKDPGRRADVRAAAVAAGLVAAAAVTGGVLYLAGRPVRASSAPLFAHWLPHAGPGTAPAVVVAVLVVWHGPAVAAALPWRRLLAAAYLASLAWILSLALVDGWQRGFAGRLSTPYEYLSEVDRVPDVPVMVRTFTDGILGTWTTHVAGHPPGALLVFVGLDRAGLGGGAWAAFACVAAGALTAVAVPVTLRALGAEPAARAAVPFVVLFPGAVWTGVSADGLFAGVTATGLALLAVALSRRSWPAALGAGVLLAGGIYLSYGMVLIAPLALAVVLAARGRARLPRAVAGAVAGAAVVVAAFTVAGFWWPDGYLLVRQRYHAGLASERPYLYWVWANLAACVVCAGPAAAPVLRRAAAGAVRAARAVGAVAAVGAARRPAVLLPLAAAVAVLLADLSGLSKAEVERIWLPFAVWLPAGAALLPAGDRRGWLAAQAATALLVNHLLLTTW